jgi:hypothetical protein
MSIPIEVNLHFKPIKWRCSSKINMNFKLILAQPLFSYTILVSAKLYFINFDSVEILQ